jgi:hypothetical protein
MKNLNVSQKIVAAVLLTAFAVALILSFAGAAGFSTSEFTNF